MQTDSAFRWWIFGTRAAAVTLIIAAATLGGTSEMASADECTGHFAKCVSWSTCEDMAGLSCTWNEGTCQGSIMCIDGGTACPDENKPHGLICMGEIET